MRLPPCPATRLPPCDARRCILSQASACQGEAGLRQETCETEDHTRALAVSGGRIGAAAPFGIVTAAPFRIVAAAPSLHIRAESIFKRYHVFAAASFRACPRHWRGGCCRLRFDGERIAQDCGEGRGEGRDLVRTWRAKGVAPAQRIPPPPSPRNSFVQGAPESSLSLGARAQLVAARDDDSISDAIGRGGVCVKLNCMSTGVDTPLYMP